MTADEFEARYAKNSKMSVEQIRVYRVVRPCDCGDESCLGWQMLSHESAAEWDSEKARAGLQSELQSEGADAHAG